MSLKNGILEAPSSILEPPGLDFGASRHRIQRVQERFVRDIRTVRRRKCFSLLGFACALEAEKLPRSCQAPGRLPSIAELLWPRDVGPRTSGGGWGGGGPPLGVCNPPPHRRCGNGVLDNIPSLRSDLDIHSTERLLRNGF